VKTAAEVLDGAADYIEQNGWAQGAAGGTYVARSYPACALGAIWDQRCPAAIEDDAVHALLVHLGLPEPVANREHPIATWNDRRERAKGEVIAALRAAAEQARTEDQP
jgi:hypothetical protein